MQERYLTTVDPGSGKIGVAVAKVTGSDIQVIYYKETPSSGIRYSCVINPMKAGTALRAALDEAEQELGIRIRQVVVGLPRYEVRQEIASARLEREPGKFIDDEEVETIKNNALDSYSLSDATREIIYGGVAQSFSTDDIIQGSESDVTGTEGEFLEGNFKVFVGARKAVTNIDLMLRQAGVECAYQVFLPDTTAHAILTESELDNGVALIEIGAGVTSLTIYQGNTLRHYSAIPFGGQCITGDIKYECGFTERLAENIKLAWGACMPDKIHSLKDKILQITDERTGEHEQLPVKYLSEIISCRAREIIEAILYQIYQSGFTRKLRCGIVLTGGGAELTNIALLVKDITGFNVRIGYPLSEKVREDEAGEISQPSAAASLGMILDAAGIDGLNCTEEIPFASGDEPQEEEEWEEEEEEIRESVDFGNADAPASGENDERKKARRRWRWGEPRVNPVSAFVPEGAARPEEPEAQESRSEEDNTDGTVFEQPVIVKRTPRKPKPKRTPKNNGSLNFTWGRKLFEIGDNLASVVGDLFDEVEDD